MRALIVAASLLLLAVADARFDHKQLHEFNLRSQAKIAKISTAARAFHPQQSSSDLLELLKPASDDPVCQEAGFSALVISIGTPCQASTLPILNKTLSPTVDAHRAAWNSYCTSSCLSLIKSSVIGSKYWICLQPLIQYFGAQANYLCTKTDSNGDYCGLTISRMSFVGGCDYGVTQASCSAIGSGTCAWTGSQCRVNPTQTLLSALCGTCLSGLNKDVNSNYPGLDSAVSTIEGSQALCSTAPSGAYCLPLLSSLTSGSSGSSGTEMFASNAMMASFCESDDTVACFGGYIALSAQDAIAAAREYFVACAKARNNESTAVTTSCLPTFLRTVSAAQSMSAIVAAMCTNFNGTYCIPAFYTLSSIVDSTSSCPSNLATIVEKLGCCMGTAQSLAETMQSISTDPSLVPTIPGYTPPLMQRTSAPAPATQEPVTLAAGEELSPNPGNGGLFELAACGIKGLNESLRVRCAQNRFKVTKNLLVKLDYAAVTANPETKKAVMLSLRRDTARAAKISPEQITDDSISATTRVQVTTSSRGMQVQAVTNGCQYTYSFHASNKAQAQAASDNVDTAVNNGYLDMSETQATVEEKCAACVGSSGVSSLNQVSSTTLDTPVADVGNGGTSSGAAAVGTLLAIILTTLALLF